MRKIMIITIVSLIILIILIFVSYCYIQIQKKKQIEQNNIRYEQIKKDVYKEMERYYRIVYPTCDPEDTAIQKVSMFTLVNTAGMDKEKFLDVDGKSYCDTITYAACVEKNKWKFKTYIKCKDYEESEAFNWENFDPEF